jgi:hypothetical protein
LPGVVAAEGRFAEGRFVEPEPGEGEAARAIGVVEGAEEDLGAVGQGEALLGFVVGVAAVVKKPVEEGEKGALGGVAQHGVGERADQAEAAGVVERPGERAQRSGRGFAHADAADIEAEAGVAGEEGGLDGVEGPAGEEGGARWWGCVVGFVCVDVCHEIRPFVMGD